MQANQQAKSNLGNCIFCKIVAGEIASAKLIDDDYCIAINDINPQAPTHILVIPKTHVSDITECSDVNMLGSLFNRAHKIAAEKSLERGFRLVVNTGNEGGQTVDHLHIHLLGGRQMHWPPG
jgi:histidine triad (HIT) family protein